jgi:predicted PurR-regulated permease PerM
MDNEAKTLDISWSGILKIVIISLIIYFVFLMKDFLLLIIFALVISVLLNPAIDLLQRFRVPRVFGTGIVYIVIFSALGYLIYLISLSFIPEAKNFIELFPHYFEKIAPPFKSLGVGTFENLEVFFSSMENWLVGASNNIFTALSTVFGGIFSAFTIFSLAFFFSIEDKWDEKMIRLIFSEKYEDHALRVWSRSQKKISGWFGSRILCCIFVGLLSFIALKILDIDNAFSLSLFAGVTNIIPYLGPLLAGLITAIIVLVDNWLKALFVVLAFFLIQQIEGNIISPVLSKKFIGLPPVLVLIALIVGAKFWGLLGAILVIPLTGIIFEFTRDFLRKKKEQEKIA